MAVHDDAALRMSALVPHGVREIEVNVVGEDKVGRLIGEDGAHPAEPSEPVEDVERVRELDDLDGSIPVFQPRTTAIIAVSVVVDRVFDRGGDDRDVMAMLDVVLPEKIVLIL